MTGNRVTRSIAAAACILIIGTACKKPVEPVTDCDFTAGMIIPSAETPTDWSAHGPFPGPRVHGSHLLTLTVDSNGDPVAVAALEPDDSAWARYSAPGLMTSRTSPPPLAPFKLVVRADYNPSTDRVTFRFPVDTSCRVADQDLIDLTLRANRYQPARVVSFPSYYADLGPDNLDRSRRFMLFRLTIDSLGNCLESELVATDYSAFVGQLSSAMLYADFSPARLDGRPVESQPFLLVSFFPLSRYPTRVYNESTAEELPYHERLALRVLNDTTGVISKPLPARVPPDSLAAAGPNALRKQTLVARMRIDTTGRPSVLDWHGISGRNRDALIQLLKTMRFYPALDASGRPRPFEGTVRIEFTGQHRAALRYNWLETGVWPGP